MVTFTDTWRANAERISQSGCRDLPVNQDNAVFLREIVGSYASATSPIFIGGQIGPRGDAYAPAELAA